ncbi:MULTISPECIES: bifunctional 2-polyprenyl-6-hydroxyphenol methylase/3-demethylubiquinol 3-O-methyltransferase UbiG [unclassified Shewanella]|jgi:2-polyprenyl-6-hydroxyphenyl methylase/3-demethylubiquinone-9 3-methyltransferase|uniref:bifunctional 2-polyprenyl-6-hydroxyphenol methylase/3-demethylubiquinol 3-O-methyltransferase UbiG n=1 Tax=unclassified Shewanella TaxID=196818 RepID=UPI000C3499B5|nr:MULTISPECIES: bifunctional 2-polyprenyl-6-hydroxyphenol methylase/3-demethylubiquinol 3-O-methyltransferase UbiG [unclassified Shewanella]MBB1361119.1 bifunctional 2-polyprenyl-6-hydroxyphenol methylase/3-demethylubiquinol 3-O-methyltransferase UbiG [Shewanella sp. SR44-4]MBO1895390.1 bifunctional 2-polyprenyl-6-hydroxyphenol methylase/3-demethylubiquinol 3-O-methyltransferase UbiG [Shewanella sp. BF02_Schw]PKH32590.1 bifunctional 3-demethylubiquinol 3-O-methyltransferase/2-polyprenyl-6-hydro
MSHAEQSTPNVDPLEIAKFEAMAQTWWDLNGEFKPLHLLNPLRLNYIDQTAEGIFDKKVLDVGCGGGILSESMARLGANVDGIDMGNAPLEVAKLHALESGVTVNYLKTTAEAHRDNHREYYDVVTCMEMLEHVPDPQSVIQACCDMVKPNGFVFFSTINRNMMSYLKTIIGAEYLLKMLPVGTHDHSKFIRPSELMALVDNTDLLCKDALGITYNPLSGVFKYTKSVDVNYMIATQKID